MAFMGGGGGDPHVRGGLYEGFHYTCISIVVFVAIETPTNDIILEEPQEERESSGEGGESDLFSGAKEMEAYQQSQAIKKNIQYNLGRRSGPRWSLPHQYIGEGVWHISEGVWYISEGVWEEKWAPLESVTSVYR